MKKILLLGVFIMYPVCAFASGYNYLDAPNPGNRSFSTLYQQQFEKEETLDFINKPEEYQTKREQKNQYLDYKEGKGEVPSFLKPEINVENSVPVSDQMQFTKGEDGQIKIREIK